MTNNKRSAKTLALLLAVLLTGMYSCNNNAATEEKKADTAVAPAVVDTAVKTLPMDTTKNPADTGRDTKVPKPPNN